MPNKTSNDMQQAVKKAVQTAAKPASPHPKKKQPKKETVAAEKVTLLQMFGKWLRAHLLFRGQDTTLKQMLEDVIEEHEDEVARLAPEEKLMLTNMLHFGETTVSEIMTPRTDIVAVESSVTKEQLKKHILEQMHTRIPVYEGTLDKVKGFIHLKDLFPMLSGDTKFDMQKVLRKILFVPPSMRIIDLLLRMRQTREHMAIVVDEYGGTDGLVTMEDLFEEIVGEIQDEHDETGKQELVWVSDRIAEADARARVDILEREIGLKVHKAENQEFDTLGGLIFTELGRIPAKGEVVDYPPDFRFEILEVDPRRIRKVRIFRLPLSETR